MCSARQEGMRGNSVDTIDVRDGGEEGNNYVVNALCGRIFGLQPCLSGVVNLLKSHTKIRSSAFMMVGPRGIGKVMLAMRTAFVALGGGLENDRVGQHQSALIDVLPSSEFAHLAVASSIYEQFIHLNHPDLLLVSDSFEVNSLQKKKRLSISIDEIRVVNRFLSLTSIMSGKKVVIVDGVDNMNRNASDALLKSLEEVGDDTIIMLIAHNMRCVAPTVRSRCGIAFAPPPSYEDFCTAISENVERNALVRGMVANDGQCCNGDVVDVGLCGASCLDRMSLYMLAGGSVSFALACMRTNIGVLDKIFDDLLCGKMTSESLATLRKFVSESSVEATQLLIEMLKLKLHKRMLCRIASSGIGHASVGRYLRDFHEVRKLLCGVQSFSLDVVNVIFSILGVR